MDYDLYDYEDDKVRFTLGKSGKRMLVVFGVNPSTATDIKLDTTATKVQGFAQRLNHDGEKKYNGWVIVNIYPKRETDPSRLPMVPDEELHKKNIQKIHALFKEHSCAAVWAAWGDTISTRPWLFQLLIEIVKETKSHNLKWIRIGELTKKGNPRHPSRLSYKNKIDTFDITEYLNQKPPPHTPSQTLPKTAQQLDDLE